MCIKSVLIPIPSYGFDPSEAAIPWKLMHEDGINIVFASPDGKKAAADRIMLSGEKLGPWKPVLQARRDAIEAYHEMEKSNSFANPIKYDTINGKHYDAILLPGGHDKAVKEYLESEILQQLVVEFFKLRKPVAAICHGVILVAKSIDSDTGNSVIHNYKTTSLLKSQELLAYNLTRFWLKDYYLTYPGLTTEDEVKSVLSHESNFLKGSTPLLKDSVKSLSRGFIVKDRNYLSARWPGDVYNFSLEFIKMVRDTEL
jgi:putative intracellular protease/amidase